MNLFQSTGLDIIILKYNEYIQTHNACLSSHSGDREGEGAWLVTKGATM